MPNLDSITSGRGAARAATRGLRNEIARARFNSHESETGVHLDIAGALVVTDLAKAARFLPVGSSIEVGGDRFFLQKNGTWKDGFGNQLVQDKSGIHVIGVQG